MRRNEKEISDRSEIDAIIRRSQVCRLGMSDNGQPYIVPLCFGYDGSALYFHCAQDGRKRDILRRNNRVCFEFDRVEGLIEAEAGCDWGIRYQSVMGTGAAEWIEDITQKKTALDCLMAQYAGKTYVFPPGMVKQTGVVKVLIESISGKQSKRLE